MDTDRPFKILFLCTGNSARSILGEYLIRRIAGDRFDSYSAGADPAGVVNPIAIQTLKDTFKIDASDARSKSWDEFEGTHFDFVITVCDNARESCPVWPGQPIVAHWGSIDPAAVEGTEEEKKQAFFQVAMQLHRRIDIFVNLPFEKLDKLRLEELTKNVADQE